MGLASCSIKCASEYLCVVASHYLFIHIRALSFIVSYFMLKVKTPDLLKFANNLGNHRSHTSYFVVIKLLFKVILDKKKKIR